jgi:hypothetical protein
VSVALARDLYQHSRGFQWSKQNCIVLTTKARFAPFARSAKRNISAGAVKIRIGFPATNAAPAAFASFGQRREGFLQSLVLPLQPKEVKTHNLILLPIADSVIPKLVPNTKLVPLDEFIPNLPRRLVA